MAIIPMPRLQNDLYNAHKRGTMDDAVKKTRIHIDYCGDFLAYLPWCRLVKKPANCCLLPCTEKGKEGVYLEGINGIKIYFGEEFVCDDTWAIYKPRAVKLVLQNYDLAQSMLWTDNPHIEVGHIECCTSIEDCDICQDFDAKSVFNLLKAKEIEIDIDFDSDQDET